MPADEYPPSFVQHRFSSSDRVSCLDHCCMDHCYLDHNWPTAGCCVLLLCVAGCFRHVYVFNVFLKQYVCVFVFLLGVEIAL